MVSALWPHRQTNGGVPGAQDCRWGTQGLDGWWFAQGTSPIARRATFRPKGEATSPPSEAVREEAQRSGPRDFPGAGEKELGLLMLAMLLDSLELVDAATTEIKHGNWWAAGSVGAMRSKSWRNILTQCRRTICASAADIRALPPTHRLPPPHRAIVVACFVQRADKPVIGSGPTILVGGARCPRHRQGETGSLAASSPQGLSPFRLRPSVARVRWAFRRSSAYGAAICVLDGHELVVDGYAGKVHRVCWVTQCVVNSCVRSMIDVARTPPWNPSGTDAVTADGQRATLYVNAGLRCGCRGRGGVGASGIGLYRSGCRSCCSTACQ